MTGSEILETLSSNIKLIRKEKSWTQEKLAESSGAVSGGDMAAKNIGRVCKDDRGQFASGEFDQRSAKEIAEAYTECRERKSGNVLVSPQRDRKEAVQKSH